MQPYFFPYIGYWQLINYSDMFVLFDDVQYIRHGWINRNRVLKDYNGNWKYITLPLEQHRREELIKNIKIKDNLNIYETITDNLSIYKKRAPYYDEVINEIEKITGNLKERNIVKINEVIIKNLCSFLGIHTKIIVSSDQKFDYSNVLGPGDWAFEISKQLGATEYTNPYSGETLFNKQKFFDNGIKISFLKRREISYNQMSSEFIQDLSILDILMFNDVGTIQKYLNEFDLSP